MYHERTIRQAIAAIIDRTLDLGQLDHAFQRHVRVVNLLLTASSHIYFCDVRAHICHFVTALSKAVPPPAYICLSFLLKAITMATGVVLIFVQSSLQLSIGSVISSTVWLTCQGSPLSSQVVLRTCLERGTNPQDFSVHNTFRRWSI
jgi:hypothetical protein